MLHTTMSKGPEIDCHPLGIVQGEWQTAKVAASLSRLDRSNRFWARCLNFGERPLDIPAGSVIGTFCCVGEEDVQEVASQTPQESSRAGSAELPSHVQGMYEDTMSKCATTREKQQLRGLLCRNAEVFSWNE